MYALDTLLEERKRINFAIDKLKESWITFDKLLEQNWRRIRDAIKRGEGTGCLAEDWVRYNTFHFGKEDQNTVNNFRNLCKVVENGKGNIIHIKETTGIRYVRKARNKVNKYEVFNMSIGILRGKDKVIFPVLGSKTYSNHAAFGFPCSIHLSFQGCTLESLWNKLNSLVDSSVISYLPIKVQETGLFCWKTLHKVRTKEGSLWKSVPNVERKSIEIFIGQANQLDDLDTMLYKRLMKLKGVKMIS